MAKKIDFRHDDPETYMNLPAEAFTDMTPAQAADILEKQVARYHKGGDFAPRPFLGRALELALQALREKET